MSVGSVFKTVLTLGAIAGGLYLLNKKGQAMIQQLRDDTVKRTDQVFDRVATIERLAEKLNHTLSEGELKTLAEARTAAAKPYLPELDMVMVQLDVVLNNIANDPLAAGIQKH